MRGPAVALVLATMLSGCGLLPDADRGPVEDLDLEVRSTEMPAPRGGVISAAEVMRGTVDGEPFTITVHPDAGNACLFLDWAPGGAGGCGGLPGGHEFADPHVGMVSVGQIRQAGHVHIIAFVGEQVASLDISTNRDDVETILVPIDGGGLDTRLAVGFLPPRTVAGRLVARDEAGDVLGEYALHELFPGPPAEYPIADPDVEESR
jgi:hypothetical protein